MTRRAQGSTEFIILLALVLVLSGIIFTLFFTSAQDSSRVLTQSENIESLSAPIGIQSYGFTARGIYFSLVNNEYGIVNITSFTLGEVTLNTTALPFLLLPGEQRDFHAYTILFNQSDPYSYTVSYTYTLDGIEKSFSGLDLVGSVPQVEDYSISRQEALAEDLQFIVKFDSESILGENATVFADDIELILDDCSGNSRCPTSSVDGFTRTAYFDGTDDYLTFNQTPAEDDDITVAFWLKNNQTISSNKYFFDAHNSGFDANGIELYAQSPTTLRFVVGLGLRDPVVPAFNDNTWHHFAFVIGSSRMITYFDGVSVDNGAFLSPTLTPGATYYIGSNRVGSQNIEGYMDEFAVWSRGLTPQEVEAIYHRGSEHLGLS